MNILHVTGKLNFGGVEKWLLEICKKNKNNKILIWVNSEDNNADLDREFEKIKCTIIRKKISKNPIINFFQMRDICKNYNVDAIHMHQHTFNGLLTLSAFFASVKVRVVHFHSLRKKRDGFIYNFYEKVMLCFCNNLSTHRIAVSNKVGFTQLIDYIVIPCGLDFDIDQGEKIINCTEKSIIQVGRFVEEKNYDFTIDLMKYINSIDRDYKLYIIGDGPLRDKIEKKISDLDLKDSVELLGLRNDVKDLLNKFKGVMIFPSISEGLGLVSLEAQINGCYCICSKNIPQEVNIGGAVFLEDYEYQNWFLAIKDCYNRESEINSKIENFTINRNIALLEEVYLNGK